MSPGEKLKAVWRHATSERPVPASSADGLQPAGVTDDRRGEKTDLEPVDPFGGGVLHVIDGPPRAPMFDHLGLVQAVDRLRERICRTNPQRCQRKPRSQRRRGARRTGPRCTGWIQVVVATPRSGVCGWDGQEGGLQQRREGLRCGRRAGRRWRGRSIGNGSGRRSLTGCSARTPGWWPACRRRWERDGCVRVAACRRSLKSPCRGVTCHSRSEKRSRSCPLKIVGCARSRGGWAVRRRRFRARCAVTGCPGRRPLRPPVPGWVS